MKLVLLTEGEYSDYSIIALCEAPNDFDPSVIDFKALRQANKKWQTHDDDDLYRYVMDKFGLREVDFDEIHEQYESCRRVIHHKKHDA